MKEAVKSEANLMSKQRGFSEFNFASLNLALRSL